MMHVDPAVEQDPYDEFVEAASRATKIAMAHPEVLVNALKASIRRHPVGSVAVLTSVALLGVFPPVRKAAVMAVKWGGELALNAWMSARQA